MGRSKKGNVKAEEIVRDFNPNNDFYIAKVCCKSRIHYYSIIQL